MKRSQPNSFSEYVVYVDESGDHGLEALDPTYPVFVLALHEHEIRKPKGPFTILFDPEVRQKFMDDLTAIIVNADFKLISVFVKKDEFRKKNGAGEHLYNVAVRLETKFVRNVNDAITGAGLECFP